jgi:DtxR family manganese transport transcriptional regulator
VPAEAAEADAEGIEHHVSETTLKAFARFLHDAGGPPSPAGEGKVTRRR